MARKVNARVVLNRSKLPALWVVVADGLHEVAKTIVEEARPPDATPYGAGLVTNGGTLAYVGNKKVAGWSLRGTQPKKPRAVRVKDAGITAIAGFGFPARFQERGTVNHGAQPFLAPTRDRVAPRTASIMRAIVEPQLRGMR